MAALYVPTFDPVITLLKFILQKYFHTCTKIHIQELSPQHDFNRGPDCLSIKNEKINYSTSLQWDTVEINKNKIDLYVLIWKHL